MRSARPIAVNIAKLTELFKDKYKLSFPERPAIFRQRLPEYDQGHKSRQHQCCKTHLDNSVTERVFAKKPTCNNAANSQELVGRPSEPIKIAVRHHAVIQVVIRCK